MKFNYQIRTKTGDVQTGVVEASSKETALSLLQEQGFYVTYLEESKVPFYARKVELFQEISLKEILLFFRQMSMMFKAKISLVETLRVLASQTGNLHFREKIFNLLEEVEGGSSFSQSLSRHPETFSLFSVAMVRAGEASGRLSETLNYLAEHIEREYRLTSKIKGALLYPSLVLLMTALVVTLMIHTIIPELRVVLEETGAEVPVFTQRVFTVSGFLKDYGLFVIFFFFLLLFLLYRYYKTYRGKGFFDKFFLKIPVLGPFLKTLYISRFAENLSTLIAGGLMIGRALELSADVIGNAIYREAILFTRDKVRKGVSVSSVLALFPEIFPPMVVQMTLVGEKTGTVDESLMKISDFYQGEVERGIENILSILEPLLVVILGVTVGGLILSVLMPLYQTMSI